MSGLPSSPQEAREYFGLIDARLIAARETMRERQDALKADSGEFYSLEHFEADCEALFRLLVTNLMDPHIVQGIVNSLIRERLIHPKLAPLYNDYVQAQNLIAQLDLQADQSMDRLGL